jgi:hypothetical protein
MSFSDTTENALLDYFLEDNLYAGTSTADPGDDGATLAEPSGGSYARVAITAATWNAASGGSKTNGAAITFAAATGDWGTQTYFCVFDSESGGNILASGALTAGKTITSGQTLNFPIGSVTVSLG